MTVHGQMIEAVLSERTRRNAAYSLRALARDLGVTHGYLSQVVRGKKKVSLKKVVHFAQRLGLSEPDAKTFRESVARSHATRPAAAPAQNDDWYALEVDAFRMIAEWHHVAILELTSLRGFRATPAWIARRLGIPRERAAEALSRLERIGLVHREGRRMVRAHRDLVIPSRASDAIRSFHRQMIEKALGALESTDPGDYAARDVTGTTIPIDSRRLAEAKRRIARFRHGLARFLSAGEPDALYQLNVQFFPLEERSRA